MKAIKSNVEYEKAAQEVFDIMNKGENNLTEKEKAKASAIALAIQNYENKLYPVKKPRTLAGMIELRCMRKN